MSYKLIYTLQAKKDSKKLNASNLKKKAQELLTIIANNPYKNSPPYEKLGGTVEVAYSRRINVQHRLVYHVNDKEKIIKIVRMWTHYE